MKKKISITVDEQILRQIDKIADKRGINRSKYIELLLRKDFEELPVLILAAAGKINSVDKSLIDYNGKKLIEHQIKYLKHQDFYNIHVATDSRLVEDYIRRSFKNVNVFYEKDLLGSGGAIKCWGQKLGKEFLVMHGDVLAGIELSRLVEFHKENKSSVTLVLKSMNPYNKYGVVKLEGSRVTDFTEKPEKSTSYLCFTGIAIFTKTAIDRLEPKGHYQFQLNQIPHKYGYVFEGFWKAFETEKDLVLENP